MTFAVKGRGIGDHISQPRSVMNQQSMAQFSGRFGRIAHHSVVVQVFCLPGETQAAAMSKPSVLAGKVAGFRRKIRCMVHHHKVRVKGQHDGSFSKSAVMAVGTFVIVDQARGQRPAHVVRTDHKHGMASPEPLRDQIDDLRLTAVSIHDDELANTVAAQGDTDLGPGGEQSFSFVTKCSGKRGVFRAFAYCLRRQDQGSEVIAGTFEGGGDEALGDQRVGPQRKVWAVLLDGADRKDCDSPFARERPEL